MTGTATSLASDELLGVILTSLETSKAEEIVKIDLSGKSEMAEWMVIASDADRFTVNHPGVPIAG